MKDAEFWDADAILKDLLFQENIPVSEIAKELGLPIAKVNQRIKQLGLEWVRKNNRKLSKGHAALTEIMRRLLPGEEIINEYHVGERLMLDVYCPSYKLGAEYHGRQHFFYTDMFHKDRHDFEAGVARDERKMELCKEQGIALIVFRFTDDLTDDSVFERMLEGIKSTPYVEPEEKKPTFKGNHFYEQMKAKRREYNKQQYRQYKKWRAGQ